MTDQPSLVAGFAVIPGPVTLSIEAARDRYWCACHGWHDRAEMTCESEKRP